MEHNIVSPYEKNAQTAQNAQTVQTAYIDNEIREINEKIKQLHEITTKNNVNGNEYRKEVENFLFNFTKRAKQVQYVNNLEKTNGNMENSKKFTKDYLEIIEKEKSDIHTKCRALLSEIENTIKLHTELQQIVIHKRLSKWKRAQIWTRKNEELLLTGLDQLQQWFEALAENICSTRSLIDSMRNRRHFSVIGFNIDEKFEEAFRTINMLLDNLILSSFIVEQQPPQVLRTNTR